MKILLITNSYSPQIRSGAERLVHNLSDRLIERGHTVKVFNCESYEQHSTLSYWQRLFFHVFGFFNIKKYFEFKTLLAQESPDLIWSHNLVGFPLIILLAFKKYKVIHSFHDIQLLHPSGLLMYKQEGMLASLAARLYQFFCKMLFPSDAFAVFPSQWLQKLYTSKGFYFKNSLVLHNPLRQYPVIIKQQDAVFSFLYLGQLEKHKGVDLLIQAFTSIKNTECRLIIAGSGSLEQDLKNTNRDDRISFIGAVSNPEEHIAQAHCLVVPSLCYENLPTAILEAQAQKTPIIGSCLGGIPELITDEKYLFVPEENAIREKLEWCLANREVLQNSVEQFSNKSLSIDEYLESLNRFAKTTF